MAMERKANIEKLPEELKQILDNVGLAIFIDDAEGYEIWFNKAAEELYEINRDEIIGKHMTELEKEGIFSPSLTLSILKKGTGESIIHENRVGRKLITSGVPLIDENGKFTKIVTSSLDITRLVNLENDLQDAHNALEEFAGYKGFLIGDMIVTSQAMKNVIQLTKRLAAVDSTILITGESGTGKGNIANLLHQNGNRRNFPFVKINCGAIPDNLLESEFFGYENGAFTGSRKGGKKGLFEVAQNGTIFLDEIGELPLNLQVKILQVLQEKEIQKVGGVAKIPVNVRIIAATNKGLEKMVTRGEFREDLYYRLNVVPIHIPPLRERPEDIISMIKSFLKTNNAKFKENKVLTSNAIAIFLKYDWPGNVRELENIIERLVITTKHSTIRPDDLPTFMFESLPSPANANSFKGLSLKVSLEMTEKSIFESVASEYRTTRQMANALGVNQSTVVRKLQKYKISYKDA